MTRKFIAFSFGALLLLLSTGAFAQSSTQATVPFAFTAGNVQLPAGEYFIQQRSESNFISIADVKTGKVVFAFAPEQQLLPMDAPTKLIFHRYGNQHFLAAFWTGSGSARVFSPNTEEKQWQTHLLASNPTDSNTPKTMAMK